MDRHPRRRDRLGASAPEVTENGTSAVVPGAPSVIDRTEKQIGSLAVTSFNHFFIGGIRAVQFSHQTSGGT